MGGEIVSGGFYEDCRYHPMLCVSVADGNDELVGISLISGFLGSCSVRHCGVVPLSFEEALARKVWFSELAARMGWPDPVSRDAEADRLAAEGSVPFPEGWRDLIDAEPEAS